MREVHVVDDERVARMGVRLRLRVRELEGGLMSWSLTEDGGDPFIPFESYRELLGRQTPTSLADLGTARWKLSRRHI